MILIRHPPPVSGLKRQLSLGNTNRNCNMTAGLEASLHLAMAMLHRNIDTKTGLVNGATGMIQKISMTAVTVKFNHVDKPYDVEKVKSRFMVLKISKCTENSFHSYWPMP